MLHLQEQVAKLAESMGFLLYDMLWCKENDQSILRVYLTKPYDSLKHTRQAITLDECALFSTALSPLLDVALTQTQSYHLEVSSPGLERVLKKPQHFILSIGEEVSISFIDKSLIEGVLCECNEQEITLKTHDGIRQIPYAQIKKAKTIFRF